MNRGITVVLVLFAALLALSVPWPALKYAGTSLPWAIYLQLLFATGFVSLAMVLSLRNLRVESWVGGLDQWYRLHRVAGQGGVGLGLLHFVIKIVSKALRENGHLLR